MISVKDSDKERLEVIVKLLSAPTVTLSAIYEARKQAEEILANIRELMQEKPHVRPLIAAHEAALNQAHQMLRDMYEPATPEEIAAQREKLSDAYARISEMADEIIASRPVPLQPLMIQGCERITLATGDTITLPGIYRNRCQARESGGAQCDLQAEHDGSHWVNRNA